MKTKKIKYTLFACILGLLCLPALQGFFRVVPSPPLEGDFIPAQKPDLTLSSWLKMDFQSAYELFLEENLGFHNSLVRINNQIDFSVFGKANAEGAVIGNEGQLFESDYIRAYLGKDFVGYEIIDRKARRLKFLQKQLKKEHNIDLVVVLEPSKASIFPEYIPKRFNVDEKTISNYEAYLEKFNEYRVQYIDFNEYFKTVKDTLPYPVFTRNGIHWSIFAMTIVADSLINYLEETRGIEMPEASIESWELTDKPQRTDNDVSKTLNLIWEPKMYTMSYPRYRFVEKPGQEKPKVLVIGDSFYWNIYNTGIPDNLFSDQAFWYFYSKVYPDFYHSPRYVEDLNIREEIEKKDIVLLTVTERFYYTFDWGFIDELFQEYAPASPLEPVYHYQNGITGYDKWFDTTLAAARLRKRSLEEMLKLEAMYAFEKNKPQEYRVLYGIEHISKNIYENPEWLSYVEKQSKDKGISLQQGILNNASYMLQKNFPEVYRKHIFIQATIDSIRSDTAWLRQVREKADYYYIPLEEMMLVEASFHYDKLNN